LALFHIFLIVATGNVFGEIIHFQKSDYKGANQNWSVSTPENGRIYFANHHGLVEFDGSSWKLYRLPNQPVIRAVKAISDSLIFTSGYMELGFWTRDKYGKLNYHSLSADAKTHLTRNVEFWNIVVKEKSVFFRSFDPVILEYTNDSIYAVELTGNPVVMNKVGDKILVAVGDVGLFEIKDHKAIPFLTGEFFKSKQIRFLLGTENQKLLIGTSTHGIFEYDGAEIYPWHPEWTKYFVDNELNRGLFTNNQLILGSIKDGIVVFDEESGEIRRLNAEGGLGNNTVLGIETDSWGNIWTALDDGIGFIPALQEKSYKIEPLPGIGAIYSIARLNNLLYLATNQGLFVKSENDPDERFGFVPETQGQIWDCQVIGEQLFVSHNGGSYLVKGSGAQKIANFSGGVSINRDTKNPDLLIQGTYTNLMVFQETGKTIKFRNSIEGFSDLTRFVEIDHKGNIWASHMYQGVYRITTDGKREKLISSEYFGNDIFGSNHSVNVFKIEDRIVFTTYNKFFTYDDLNDTIVPFDAINKQLGKFAGSHRVIAAPNHHYWLICNDFIGLFFASANEMKLVKEYPASVFSDPPLVDGYENILPTGEKTAILSLLNGIAWLDANINDTLAVFEKYKPEIREILVYNNRDKIIQLPLNTSAEPLKFNFNNIRFRVSFPLLNGQPVNFRYFIKGLSKDWSEKSISPEFSFERVPPGEYTLEIKAVDLWENESQICSYSFEILPPWYSSKLAVIVYTVLFVIILLLFRNWGIRQTRRKEKEQHEAREKELIKLRNEKLASEVEHKSKELANSTMSFIKKNEFLMELKTIIEKHKTELGSRYPDKYYNYLNKKIDENISNQDDWQIFENNFERAHEQFFAKLQASFPDLTPGDLRLCAYLRMNLSSKEIAPLLGISVRGVENHRYRLRKKMNMEHDDSLAHVINSI
jgi:DNA-binding CsgD family transcriptional regulator